MGGLTFRIVVFSIQLNPGFVWVVCSSNDQDQELKFSLKNRNKVCCDETSKQVWRDKLLDEKSTKAFQLQSVRYSLHRHWLDNLFATFCPQVGNDTHSPPFLHLSFFLLVLLILHVLFFLCLSLSLSLHVCFSFFSSVI
jgi:hypothetical protein